MKQDPTTGAGPADPLRDAPGWRLAALATLLDRAGITYHTLRAAGGGEIAVVEAPRTEAAALAGVAPAVRRLGFRFVALDLAGCSPRGAAPDRGPAPGTEEAV